MTHHHDPFAQGYATARQWLAAVANRLGIEDDRHACRVLRAWLHLVRDRLPVVASAHFSAQLPDVLRGIYFDGWTPAKVPIRDTAGNLMGRFAIEAGVDPATARDVASAISEIARAKFSPGQLDHALTMLPKDLRTALAGLPLS